MNACNNLLGRTGPIDPCATLIRIDYPRTALGNPPYETTIGCDTSGSKCLGLPLVHTSHTLGDKVGIPGDARMAIVHISTDRQVAIRLVPNVSVADWYTLRTRLVAMQRFDA
jgi:hypothetical protein